MITNKKQILEAIQRGINLAIDDFDDIDIEAQKIGQIKHSANTRELIKYSYFVDLDLPSGTLWNKYNIGVDPNKLSSAEDWYGNYYAWGEIEEKQYYSWKTYKYANESFCELTKYCDKAVYCDNDKPDNLTTLQDIDDIAVQTNNLPWEIKMPTKEQIEELLEYTTSEWIEKYQGISGLNGRIFTSKTNGNQMFIPAAGYRADSLIHGVGWNCYLWTRSLNQITPSSANALYFIASGCYLSASRRCDGRSVRQVLINQ